MTPSSPNEKMSDISTVMTPRDKKAGKIRPCKRLSADTEDFKAKQLEGHKAKMAFKARRRANWHKQRQQSPIEVTANVKASHKLAGKHPKEVYA